MTTTILSQWLTKTSPQRASHAIAALLAMALIRVFVPSTEGALSHRYSFSEPAGATTVKDSAGTADGAVQGAAGFTGSGALTLQGTGGYVDLPNGIVSSLNNATFEAWVTFQGGGGAWQRIFDFGSNSNGEDQQGTGTTYLFLTPRVGTTGALRFALSRAQGAGESPVLNGPSALPIGQQSHVAVTYDFSNKTAKLFLNGRQVAAGAVVTELKTIQDVNNWLGRSNWPDAYFNGSFNEFRIYDTALSGLDVALSALAGPDSTQRPDPGALQSISLTVSSEMVRGRTQQASVSADYANITGIAVTTESGTTYQSSDANVVKVSASGLLEAVGTGTATLTASHGSKQATKNVQVVLAPTPPAVLKHRYSFTENSGDAAKDSVGTAHGTLIGATFTGDGKADFLQANSAYIDLPNGIISALTNASFEAWFTFDGEAGVWQRVFDFGNNANGEDQQGTGSTYLFMTSRVGGNGPLRFAATLDPNGTPREIPILDGPVLPTGTEVYVAVTYNVAGRTGKLYYNGAQASSGEVTIPLNQIQDVNNWLGRSNWPDAFFDGQFNEFRIYEGILSDQQIAVNAALGPNALGGELGALASLRMQVNTNALVLGGLSAQASVFADFQNVKNVIVTAFADTTYASSDVKVATVTPAGRIDPVGAGTATISATYQGKQATATVTVAGQAGPAARLVHRYSFSDAAGSTVVKDSAGTADGALVGTGTFAGGKLTLTGTDGYVDLPNGIISSLTNATFEAWVTWNSARTWERIFDFGNSTAGEDASGAGETYLFLTPLGGSGVVRFASTVNSGGGEMPVLNGAARLIAGQETHLVVTYNMALGVARLYVNGQRVASGAATIPLNTINDINNWLGRSQWNDPYLNGDFNEFRIYDGALSDTDVAASYAAGADALPAKEPPRVSFARSAAQLTISWPADATGFVLETAERLGPGAAWTSAGLTPKVEGGLNKLDVPITGTTRFYRLKK
ncbi:MAG: hypothetical protein HY735_10510 [Verrucomicrobia bacterium]|nr:hypothetical protein [Verrucomicrobiota bacterium]